MEGLPPELGCLGLLEGVGTLLVSFGGVETDPGTGLVPPAVGVSGEVTLEFLLLILELLPAEVSVLLEDGE